MNALFRKACCFVLITVICMTSFCSCSFKKTDAFVTAVNNNTNSSAVSSAALHTASMSDFSFIASSGFIELYYDSSTCSVAVFDTSSASYWTALPFFSGEGAAMINAVLFSDNGRCYLNSQDNSVAFSAYSAEYFSDGIKLVFSMSDNEATARKNQEELLPGEMLLIVPLEIRLVDGNMTVRVIGDEVFVSEGFVLESLTLMPYFGALCYTQAAQGAEAIVSALSNAVGQEESALAETEAESNEEDEDEKDGEEVEEGEKEADGADDPIGEQTSDNERLKEQSADFIFVPDGCGAVMYTEKADPATDRVSFRVYGDEALEECRIANVPAFGVKKHSAAFVAVIGDGAERATIKANRAAADIDSVNKVSAEFAMAPVKTLAEKTYYSDRFTGDVSLCYRFMSGSEANYISMAASCREYLIRLGLLSSKSIRYDVLPVNISVIGSVDGGYKTHVSDFEDCEDMLGVIKAKGVNSVNLILQGFLPGGMLQNSSDSVSPMRKNGGKSDFESLCDYAAKQKFNVFTGINILTAAADSDSALSVSGKTVGTVLANPLFPYIGRDGYAIQFLSADKIEKNVISLMNSAKKLTFAGFCINDAAIYAYADHSGDGTSSAALSDIVASNVSAFAIRNNLMLRGCNFNVIKDASMLTDVPFYTSYEESEAYCAIPFIPAILHSTMGYSGRPANTADLPRIEMLKCIEYAGVPYFQWVFSMKSHLYYGLNLTESVDFMLRAAQELSDLSGERIISHRAVESGVYETGFESGSLVYVNYNNYSVNVGNISVLPYDYVRIN